MRTSAVSFIKSFVYIGALVLKVLPAVMTSKSQNYKNSEVKGRISERLESVVIDSGKLAQAVTKSSRSREILYHCTKSFAGVDSTLTNTDQSLKLIEGNLVKLDAQAERLNDVMKKINAVNEKVQRINKK